MLLVLTFREASSLKDIAYFSVDICDNDVIARILNQVRPREIYHLAVWLRLRIFIQRHSIRLK